MLEARLLERITQLSKRQGTPQRVFGFVTTSNFFGLDINAFAVELAKVTMMLGRKLAIDELHITERALPLDNLDGNFIAGDALIDDSGNPRQWPATSVIIGNPPFIGAKHLKPERGRDYVARLRQAYPKIPGMADYCVYWFRRAHDHLKPCTTKDPLSGRAGLVGTQNIRNNQSRVAGLDHVVSDGTIIEAVDNQPWSGEANVHVSIVNWVKSQDESVVGKSRRLWSKAGPTLPLFAGDTPGPRKQTVTPAKRKAIRKDKSFELVFRECKSISSALSDQVDVSGARKISANSGLCYTGQYPRHDGFMLTAHEAKIFLYQERRNREVVWPFLVGGEMLTAGAPVRWVIDFQLRSIIESQSYPMPFARLEKTVLPHITGMARLEREKTGKATGQDQKLATDLVAAFPTAPGVDRQTFQDSAVHCLLPCHKAPYFRVFVYQDTTRRCPLLLHIARRLQLWRPSVRMPLAMVHGEVFKAHGTIPIHPRICFRHISLAPVTHGHAG